MYIDIILLTLVLYIVHLLIKKLNSRVNQIVSNVNILFRNRFILFYDTFLGQCFHLSPLFFELRNSEIYSQRIRVVFFSKENNIPVGNKLTCFTCKKDYL